MSRRLRHGWPLGAWPPSPSGRGLLLRAARQRAGAPSRWAGLGVSHRPEAHRDAMISRLPRRLRTADPREGHRPGGGAGGLGPPGRYRPDAVLADAGRDGHRGRGAIGAAVVAGSAALPGSGQDKGIEVMTSIIVIRRFTGTRLARATSERRASSWWRSGSSCSPPVGPSRHRCPSRMGVDPGRPAWLGLGRWMNRLRTSATSNFSAGLSEALRDRPDLAASLNDLAAVLQRRGRCTEAVNIVSEAN